MDTGIVEHGALVLRQDRGPVAWLRLNRPARGNLLSDAMLDALLDALADAEADPDVRVIVLAAAGKLFCAGHDLAEIRAHEERDRHAALFAKCSAMMLAIERGGTPVIACVQGTAAAGGCQLVAACDLAYAADTARFGLTGINLGLFCSTPAVPVSRSVAAKPAMELLLTGRLIDAAEAARIGLVNAAVPAEALEAKVDDIAAAIADKPPEVIRMGKALFQRQLRADTQSAYAMAGAVMADNLALPAARAGIDGYLHRKRPA
jgi:enoyl-CoA hydratase/carnithine racemase